MAQDGAKQVKFRPEIVALIIEEARHMDLGTRPSMTAAVETLVVEALNARRQKRGAELWQPEPLGAGGGK